MKEYTNGEIVVCWEPKKCTHSRNCVKGLPEVFDRGKRPWINMSGASSEEIMKVIDRCPSGALSYRKVGGIAVAAAQKPSASITVLKKGPLLVKGSCQLIGKDGKKIESCGPFALCRCGGSKKKPFCDGTHAEIRFDD
ncbi:MAG: (4Fe-4S)-binding protein [Methanotrichaceae archaeon]|nr:(4Fe-4S)-binding protein [Methanotrichaceae archaeon]